MIKTILETSQFKPVELCNTPDAITFGWFFSSVKTNELEMNIECSLPNLIYLSREK